MLSELSIVENVSKMNMFVLETIPRLKIPMIDVIDNFDSTG